ncbi:hypothetical protein [Micromonospora palythoicola]|uniref:hypothetical protein n=1 Tax=Micromonospora palythoicola TaxID=3120507 RepID=UPI002FCE3D81
MTEHVHGDQIIMRDGQVQIGKVVGPALSELIELIAALQEKGHVDNHGNVVDPTAAAAHVGAEKGRFGNLGRAVGSGLGPVLQNTIAGTAAQFIVRLFQ